MSHHYRIVVLETNDIGQNVTSNQGNKYVS